MRAIDILSEEHRLLMRVLRCLETLLQETLRDDGMDSEAAAKILGFLECFADGCHQDKEEELLFPSLLAASTPDTRGMIRGLLRGHEEERRLLDELRAHFEAAAYGDRLSLDIFVTRAREYVALQRQHARNEDVQLFPMAEAILGDRADVELVAGFARIDQRYLSKLERDPACLGAELCARFEVATRGASNGMPARAPSLSTP